MSLCSRLFYFCKKGSFFLLFFLPLTLFASLSFYDFFRTNHSVMLIIDAHSGKIVDANNAAQKFYQYTLDDFKQLNISDINTFSQEQVLHELKLAKKQNRNFFIFRHRLNNGEIKTVEVRTTPYVLENQNVLISIIQDITLERVKPNDVLHYQEQLEALIDEQTQELEKVHHSRLIYFAFTTLILAMTILILLKMLKNLKQLKDTLTYKNNEIEHLLDNNAVAIFLANSKRNICKVNQRAYEMFGYSKDELQNQNFEILHISKESFENFAPQYQRLLQKEVTHIDYTFKKKDGTHIWCSVYGTLIDCNACTNEIIWTLIDITDKKTIQEEREKAIEKLELTLKANSVGVWDWDIEKNKIIWDKNLYHLLGYEENAFEVTYEKWQSLLHIQDKEKAHQSIQEQLKKSDVFIDEFRYKKADNSWIWIEARGKVIRYDKRNNPLQMVGINTDITHLKEYETILKQEVAQKTKELNALNKHLEQRIEIEVQKNLQKDILIQQKTRLAAIGEMIGNIAHQWRQPLSVITTSVSGLKIKEELDLVTSTDIKEVNECVMKNANFLSHTIDNFRNFFANEEEVQRTFIVANVLENTINIIKNTYDHNFITLMCKINKNIAYYGSENLLSQVILNLLTNAKDALLAHNIKEKYVYIELFEKNERIYITIQDNAGGIEHDIQDKIFDPYFTTKHQSQGTGLGLYISNQIIETHFNGNIYNENKRLKQQWGSCFTIEFPKEHL
ncbi:MAG: PAS domain S-box protein [Arcobacteraceae bacterium]